MTFQIHELILYNDKGDKRALPFKPGKINIITGPGNTGKSAIIPIIEYCLASTDCDVPIGLIRNSIACYALRLDIEGHQILLARPRPVGNTTTAMYFETGDRIPDRNLTDLTPNSTVAAVRDHLNNLIGITPYRPPQAEGSRRATSEASIHTAVLLCFQKQTVLANDALLFHRTNDAYVGHALKDVFPYYLGAAEDEDLSLQRAIRAVEHELLQAERAVEQVLAQQRGEAGEIEGLLSEARAVGLIEASPAAGSPAEAREMLRTATILRPAAPPPDVQPRLLELHAKRTGFQSEYNEVAEDRRQAIEYQTESLRFAREAGDHERRLSSINLYPRSLDSRRVCPLCLKPDLQIAVEETEIRQGIGSLRDNLQLVKRQEPRLARYVEQTDRQLAELNEKVVAIDRDVQALILEDQRSKVINDANARQARVAGRVSHFLDRSPQTHDMRKLEARLADAKAELERLRNEAEANSVAEKLDYALSQVSEQMTKWAQDLGLEHSTRPVHLDIKRLTVLLEVNRKLSPMYKIGGGRNWEGYHVVSHLALHKWFIEENRPIPRFLVLDQPTQVYHATGDDSDEDSVAIRKTFDLLFRFVETHSPKFQIIIAEHARLKSRDYKRAIVEDWWESGGKLIPPSWYETELWYLESIARLPSSAEKEKADAGS